ncbi:GrpB domain, predicted nucleotidyltransferase, UPF0157 family [Prauserella alba]|nr:GrpB domain, predicted nucleotidyltransferase, UPF0157 family [Prauserella alba]
MLVHGPRPARVEIVDYHPEWPRRFARRAAELRELLGERARLVEHIGSTSVPGLAAKPVVDIVVGIDDPDDEPAYLPEPGHRALRAGEPDEPVNLHCYAPDDVETRRYLVLRDHLRNHPDDRDRYAAVKRELARREWADMNYYAEAKGPVIREILGRAGWIEP